MKTNFLPVSDAFFKYIIYSFFAFISFLILDFIALSIVAAVAVVAVFFIYRNPSRDLVAYEKNNFLSPVDGKVVSVSEIKDKKYLYRIEIDSNYLDISTLRIPFDSNINHIKAKQGSRLSQKNNLVYDLNESLEFELNSSDAKNVKIKHILTQSIDSVHIDINYSEHLTQSSIYGTMLSGITLMYIPKNFKLEIHTGDRVKASQSTIGYFKLI